MNILLYILIPIITLGSTFAFWYLNNDDTPKNLYQEDSQQISSSIIEITWTQIEQIAWVVPITMEEVESVDSPGQQSQPSTQQEEAPKPVQTTTVPKQTDKPKETATILPQEKIIECQFYPQAPRANWVQPYEDYCEEATVIIWVNCMNEQTVDLKTFEWELSDIDHYFTTNFWKSHDQNIDQMAQAIAEQYTWITQIVEEPTFDDLKQAVAKWYVIIVPLDGRQLKNPHYRNWGPDYHALLVVGYKWDKVVTHDVGTSHWAYYEYDKDVFFNAIHDLDRKNITNGKKRFLIIHR